MAVPTIVGIVKKVDDTAYVGKLTFYRLAPAMFNAGSFVVLSSLSVYTNNHGAMSVSASLIPLVRSTWRTWPSRPRFQTPAISAAPRAVVVVAAPYPRRPHRC